MMKQHKIIFFILCALMFLLNGFMGTLDQVKSVDAFIGVGLGASILSIPIWSCLGVVLSNFGIFFYKLKNPNDDELLNIWQKASLGLLVAIVFKPLLGIIW